MVNFNHIAKKAFWLDNKSPFYKSSEQKKRTRRKKKCIVLFWYVNNSSYKNYSY